VDALLAEHWRLSFDWRLSMNRSRFEKQPSTRVSVAIVCAHVVSSRFSRRVHVRNYSVTVVLQASQVLFGKTAKLADFGVSWWIGLGAIAQQTGSPLSWRQRSAPWAPWLRNWRYRARSCYQPTCGEPAHSPLRTWSVLRRTAPMPGNGWRRVRRQSRRAVPVLHLWSMVSRRWQTGSGGLCVTSQPSVCGETRQSGQRPSTR